MNERLAMCSICRRFAVPWGDHVGKALMDQHQSSADCRPDPAIGKTRSGYIHPLVHLNADGLCGCCEVPLEECERPEGVSLGDWLRGVS